MQLQHSGCLERSAEVRRACCKYLLSSLVNNKRGQNKQRHRAYRPSHQPRTDGPMSPRQMPHTIGEKRQAHRETAAQSVLRSLRSCPDTTCFTAHLIGIRPLVDLDTDPKDGLVDLRTTPLVSNNRDSPGGSRATAPDPANKYTWSIPQSVL